ncbi:MAG: hypothetical protein KF789_07210 [Bdellovibrionaceae bacterium]|nr:hypothetical protein [Pseudobdellovibrionaceae bacterium]
MGHVASVKKSASNGIVYYDSREPQYHYTVRDTFHSKTVTGEDIVEIIYDGEFKPEALDQRDHSSPSSFRPSQGTPSSNVKLTPRNQAIAIAAAIVLLIALPLFAYAATVNGQFLTMLFALGVMGSMGYSAWKKVATYLPKKETPKNKKAS